MVGSLGLGGAMEMIVDGSGHFFAHSFDSREIGKTCPADGTRRSEMA